MTEKNVKIVWVLLVVACIGFFDATYLAVEHFRGVIPPCTILLGCETVTTSGYATLMGVPVALLGSLFYFVIISLLAWYIRTGKETIMRHMQYLTVVGLVASAYFVYLQLAVIGAICQWCMVSAASSTALFAISWFVLKNKNNVIQKT